MENDYNEIVIEPNNLLFDIDKFSHITQQLINWDLNPIEGRGIYLGAVRTKYGHIEIKIYQSKGLENLIIWRATQEQLPDGLNVKSAVEGVFKNFIIYFSGIKRRMI